MNDNAYNVKSVLECIGHFKVSIVFTFSNKLVRLKVKYLTRNVNILHQNFVRITEMF